MMNIIENEIQFAGSFISTDGEAWDESRLPPLSCETIHSIKVRLPQFIKDKKFIDQKDKLLRIIHTPFCEGDLFHKKGYDKDEKFYARLNTGTNCLCIFDKMVKNEFLNVGLNWSHRITPRYKFSPTLGEFIIESINKNWASLALLQFWRVAGLDSSFSKIDVFSDSNNQTPYLKILDLRACVDLNTLPSLPNSLQELILRENYKLKDLSPSTTDSPLQEMRSLDIGDCREFKQESILSILKRTKSLHYLTLTYLPQLEEIKEWPSELNRILIHNCKSLKKLPLTWPTTENFYRLDIENAEKLEELPDFPESLDYINLQGCKNLKKLPKLPPNIRSLFIYGCDKLEIPDEIKPTVKGQNVAQEVLAHFDEELVEDNELKIILLGNGRVGKTSLAKRLIGEGFDENEESTHAIKLWEGTTQFIPEKETGKEEETVKELAAKLNIWDFGGQDLYHNTHRRFLQEKALYIICVNEFNAGSDADSDVSDSSSHENDEPQSLDYWITLVQNIKIKGNGSRPPILIVKTKFDEKNEGDSTDNGIIAYKKLTVINFSAKESTNLERLKNWIAIETSKLLGKKDRRNLGVFAKNVKKKLQEKNKERTIKKSDIYQLIDEEYKNNADCGYVKEPDLLINRFHKTGFLYFDKEYLPDDIILDQRWVIEGIYAPFNRKGMVHKILQNKGRFSKDFLYASSSEDSKYSDDDQSLFLKYMLSSGMIYQNNSSAIKDAEYQVVDILPDKNSSEKIATEIRGGTKLYKNKEIKCFMDKSEMIDFLSKLGKVWKNGMLVWNLGCQVRSFKKTNNTKTSFIYMNWKKVGTSSPSGDYIGEGHLSFKLYGENKPFFKSFFEKFGFLSDEELSRLGLKIDKSKNSAEKPIRFDDFAPSTPLIRVGLSFAGNSDNEGLEEWPSRIREYLRSNGFEVEDYRTDQKFTSASHSIADGSRKGYMNHLIKNSDCVIFFLSKKYLLSPYCMYEYFIYEEKNNSETQGLLMDELCKVDRIKVSEQGEFLRTSIKCIQSIAANEEDKNDVVLNALSYGDFITFIREEDSNIKRLPTSLYNRAKLPKLEKDVEDIKKMIQNSQLDMAIQVYKKVSKSTGCTKYKACLILLEHYITTAPAIDIHLSDKSIKNRFIEAKDDVELTAKRSHSNFEALNDRFGMNRVNDKLTADLESLGQLEKYLLETFQKASPKLNSWESLYDHLLSNLTPKDTLSR